MSVIKYIIKRYLRFDKAQPFISITGILAFLGVMVGVMVLIVAMAIMNGMSKEFQKKLFTMNYPLTIYPKYFSSVVDRDLLLELESKFSNLKFSPYVKSQVIIKKGDTLNGAMLFGVDYQREAQINEVLAEAIDNKSFGKFELIAGEGLVDELFLTENEKVRLIFTDLEASGFSLIPKMKSFKFKSTFSSGLIAYDKSYLYTDLKSIKRVTREPADIFNGIHVYSSEPMRDITPLQDFLRERHVSVVGWWEQNGNFFSAIEVEKRALFIVLMLIVLVASLNIISSLLMTVMNRRKEIALMLSLGVSKSEVKKIFLYLGFIIGIGGVIFGVMFGFIALYLLENFDIINLPADVYGVSRLPVDLDSLDFIFVIIGSIFIIFISSLYPAKKASEVDILNVLRNE